MVNSKFTQTDLNLAINYITLERLIHCMGIDEQLFDEHEELPVIFDRAAKGTLDAEFHKIAEQSQESLASLFQKLHDIFGLDGDTLTGKKQIDLGIGVDPNAQTNSKEKYSMEEIQDYILEEENKGNLPAGTYDEVLEHGTTYSDKILSSWYKQANEEIHINTYLEFESIVSVWESNPTRVNVLGLLTFLVEQHKLGKNDFITLYKESFDEVALDKGEEDPYRYTITGKQNIYCLDSIIYYILRADQYHLEGHKTNGESKHKLLDVYGGTVPYPLCIKKQSTPNLISALKHLKSLGYVFDYSYSLLIEYSTIEAEIEHYNKDIIPRLQVKCDTLLELITQGLSEGMDAEQHEILQNRLEKAQAELKEIKQAYIPSLEASQVSFDKNKDAWVKNQIVIIQASANIPDKKVVCKEIMEMANKKKGGGPWIKVREPYYKYIPLESRAKKQKKKNKEKE